MTDTEQKLFSTIEKLQQQWSDMLGIAFNGVIGLREQVKELTAQVETLTQEVAALRREIKEPKRHLFSGENP